jgi:glycosyltransferase involved in cell wall biosynthesis
VTYVDYYTEETIPFFERYDFLICNTKRHYGVFDWHPGAHYVCWGTDIDLYTPHNCSNDDVVRFFHSAGFNPLRKGTDFILKAFEKIESPHAKLIIHSQRSLKKFFPKMETLIEMLIKTGRLEYHEKTIGAPGLYHLGDVYLYPSRLDGLGLTVAEALACGLPIVTCDAAPMNEFVNINNGWLAGVRRVHSRKDGYYWPIHEIDEKNFLSIIQSILHDPKILEKKKENARRYALDYLDWSKQEATINKIFEETKKREIYEVPDTLINNYDKRKIAWQRRTWKENLATYSFYSYAKKIWNFTKPKT